MTTTHLFVELLVIGFGAIAWLVVLGATVFGYDLDHSLLSWQALVPLLSVVYVLGIVIDRVADWLVGPLDRRHLEQYFKEDKDAYFSGRRMLVVYGPALWAHLEYGRSRLRICRGWALNSLLLMVTITVYAWVHNPPSLNPCWRLWAANLMLATFFGLCFGCWWGLNKKEYQKIQRQSDWIKSMQTREGELNDRRSESEIRARSGQVANAAGISRKAESLEG